MGKKKKDKKDRRNVGVPVAVAEAWSTYCLNRGWVNRTQAGRILLWFMSLTPIEQDGVLNPSAEEKDDCIAGVEALLRWIKETPSMDAPLIKHKSVDEESVAPRGSVTSK